MISVKFLKRRGLYVAFKVSGHADYADAGEDVVCAAVSSAVQLVCNAATDIFKIPSEISVNGGVKFKLKNAYSDEAQKLISAFLQHMRLLAKDYKKNIKIEIIEVCRL